MRVYLTVDIGGTKTSTALFNQNGEMIDESFKVTPSKTYEGEESVYKNTLRAVQKTLNDFNYELIGVGVGAPGSMDTKAGVILHAPMMGWHNYPIVKRLQDKFGVTVKLENDSNLGVLAEQRCGVAKGLKNIGYMTVSTGIGGGLYLNGDFYRGKNGGAAEFGHISINPDGEICPCGNYGCLELYASGTALERRLNRGFKNAKQLAIAASEGDIYALKMYDEVGYYLGLGITTIWNMLDLDMLVLGGGLTHAREHFKKRLFSTIKERTIQEFSQKQVAFSVLNDRAILYGAYYLISEEKKNGKNLK